MASRYVVCEGCSRHVKRIDPSCPFCGRGTSGAPLSSGEPYRRMAAAAAVAAGVVAATGCSSDQKSVAFYGGAEIERPGDDSGSNSGDDGPAGSDAPSIVAFYGLANPMPVPSDASKNDALTPDAADGGDSALPGDGSAEG